MADEKPKSPLNPLEQYYLSLSKQPELLNKAELGAADTLNPEVRRMIAEAIEKAVADPELRKAAQALGEAAKREIQERAYKTGLVDFVAANAWLLAHWPAPRSCPVCGVEKWGFAPSFLQIPTADLGFDAPPRPYPAVALVCGNCGNTLFFNAVMMGLLPQGQK